MNIFYYYGSIFKEYLQNKKQIAFCLLTTVIIYLLHKILIHTIHTEYIDFIYWNLISPCFIYIFMTIVCINYLDNRYKKNSESSGKNVIKVSSIMIIVKILWNTIKIIILESNLILVNEKSSLYPIFFTFLSWLCIYFFAAFKIPHAYFNNKKYQCYSYILKNMSYLILNLLFAIIFSFSLIIIISYICAKIQGNISYFRSLLIHSFIEDFLSILFKIIFSHLIIIMIIKTYKRKKALKNH